MTRTLTISMLAAIAAGVCGVALVAPRFTADAAVVPTTPSQAVAQRYGIIRYDPAVRRWSVVSTAFFQPSGLSGVSCSAASGKLTVSFVPLGTVGTFSVDEDDAYAGRYDAGAAVSADHMTITIRKSSSGAVVPCGASRLRIMDSGLQLSITGTPQLPSPPTAPTAAPPTKPVESPSPSVPASNPATPPTTEDEPPPPQGTSAD